MFINYVITNRNINPETNLGYNNKSGYNQKDPRYHRNLMLIKKYNLNLIEWERLFDSQGRVCKICSTDKMRGKNWHTDHNHETGEVRGILCGWCNTALGKFQESKEIMMKAIKYIGK